MRILFFGSGSPASIRVLEALAIETTIVGVVVPAGPAAGALVETAQRRRLKTYTFDSRLAGHIDPPPDLIVVATFPSILPPDLIAIAPRGGINLHWSLLPKHRGPDPLFWTYLNDDRETGVTVHWLDEGADTGPVMLQRSMPLERGRPLLDLYRDLSALAALLAIQAIRSIEGGRTPRLSQDENVATREPSRNAGPWAIDTAHWPAERVWHILHGLTIDSGDLLGRPHGSAREYVVAGHDRVPGMIETTAGGMRVYCVDGWVDVDPPPRTTLLRRIIRRLRPRR